LFAREPHHHHPFAVGTHEVPAEGAEQLVTMAPAQLAELGLCDETEVAHGRQRHVLQRQLDMLALPGAAAVPFGRQQAGGDELPRGQVPGRQHMVDRLGAVRCAGDVGDADAHVGGVVHRRAAMAVPLQRELDQVGPSVAQLVVVEPAARRKVGDEQSGILAGCGDQSHREFPAFRPGDVQHHRALALVQAAPEQAGAIFRHGPAPVVEPAAGLVDPDHVGAHLGQCHAAEGRRDEGRCLHDAHAAQDAGDICSHGVRPPSM
jgi:hypothetical protein